MSRPGHEAQRRRDTRCTTTSASTEPGPLVRPYGDTTGDGMVQVSFTLPLPHDKRAEGAALQLARKMGLDPALVVHAKAIGPHFTYFVVYGSVTHLVDMREVEVAEREFPLLSARDVNAAHPGRAAPQASSSSGPASAPTPTRWGSTRSSTSRGSPARRDWSTTPRWRSTTSGAQVLVPDLVNTARDLHADAVLVSQVVTQKDAHIHNTTAMSAAFREAFPAGRVPLLVVGGPRFEEGSAAALGVDRIFGRGTTPGEVASYLVHALVRGNRPHHPGA